MWSLIQAPSLWSRYGLDRVRITAWTWIPCTRKVGRQWPCHYTIYGSKSTIFYYKWHNHCLPNSREQSYRLHSVVSQERDGHRDGSGREWNVHPVWPTPPCSSERTQIRWVLSVAFDYQSITSPHPSFWVLWSLFSDFGSAILWPDVWWSREFSSKFLGCRSFLRLD